ncbi:MAG: hypothetical protein WEA56_06820 [Balneolaceae bacterium]
MRKIYFALGIILFVCSFLFLTSCDSTFEPLGENDKYHFSIYGFLDVNADTQWVRVGTARQAIDDAPDPTGITVTLENLQTGEIEEMQDSLFKTQDFLNYWTTMDIENEQTYRIKAEGTEGNFSHVDLTTPIALPTPLVLENTFPPYGFSVYIDDVVEHIADIQSRWYVILNPETNPVKKTFTFTYRTEMKHVEVYDGTFTVFAPLEDEEDYIEGNIGINEYKVAHRQFFVAAAGPEWDENISSIDDLEYFINSTASNVENGLGYVTGIDSKWVPYFTCQTPDNSDVIPCEPEEPFW